jgi:hypothetical protein
VTVVFAGLSNAISSAASATSMCTSAAAVAGSAASSVATAGIALSSAATHQSLTVSSRANRPPGPAIASLSPGAARSAHSEAGPTPCSTNWSSSVLLVSSNRTGV